MSVAICISENGLKMGFSTCNGLYPGTVPPQVNSRFAGLPRTAILCVTVLCVTVDASAFSDRPYQLGAGAMVAFFKHVAGPLVTSETARGVPRWASGHGP